MIALLAIILALAAPTVASAQGGTDEYVEQLPGAGGNEPSEQSAGDPETDDSLTPAQEEVVEEQGADGSAALDLAQATGPDGGGDSAQGGSGGGDQAGSKAGTGLPGVVGNVAGESDDSGTGILLPLVIGGTLIGALAFVILRRRRRHAAS